MARCGDIVLVKRVRGQMRPSKSYFSTAIATSIFLFCIVISPAQEPNPVTKSQSERSVIFTAIDKDRKPVETLRREDFRIAEDGVPQSIINLRLVKDQSLALAILIDVSLSQEKTLGGQQFAATYFVTSTVKAGHDRAAVATFTNLVKVKQGLTDDLDRP